MNQRLSTEVIQDGQYRPDRQPEVLEARALVERMADRLHGLRSRYEPLREDAEVAGRTADEVATLHALGDAPKRAVTDARARADKLHQEAERTAEEVRIAESALEVAREKAEKALHASRVRVQSEIRREVQAKATALLRDARGVREGMRELWALGEKARCQGVAVANGSAISFGPLTDDSLESWEYELKGLGVLEA